MIWTAARFGRLGGIPLAVVAGLGIPWIDMVARGDG